MSEKVQNIQSAASDDAAVHRRGFDGFPPHPGRRADEYRIVDKALTCPRCIKLEGLTDHSVARPELKREDFEENETPDSVTYKVTFEKIDPVTKDVIWRGVVYNVHADGPMGAIESAVEYHLKVSVVEERTFVFNPGE